MKNFYDLLARSHAAKHLFAERFFFHPGDKILRDLEIHIRIEQGQPHLAEGIGDIRFRDPPLPSQVFENILKLVGKSAKHGAGIYARRDGRKSLICAIVRTTPQRGFFLEIFGDRF